MQMIWVQNGDLSTASTPNTQALPKHFWIDGEFTVKNTG